MNRHLTFNQLRLKVSEFRDQRNWKKYHTPKNLAISIAVETSELLEQFQWKTDEEISREVKNHSKILEVSAELADIVIYCLALSDILGIDLAHAITRKILQNAKKYPVTK